MTGRALATGAPTEIRVTEDEIRQAMSEPVHQIVEAVRRTIAEAPPELTHDVLEAGMFLTGGGGLLRGLDLLLSQECEVPVHLTERPLETVVLGLGRDARTPRRLPDLVPARAQALNLNASTDAR